MTVWPRAAPLAVMALTLVQRLYRLADYTVFQGDQGVDALVARRLVVEHVLPLEGPVTSAGGVHLGPLYYYLLALPMFAAGFDPVLQAGMMAVLGALAVGVLYWLVQHWFGPTPALIAAGLYAVSPAAVLVSRSAWNPGPAPFFLLVALSGLAVCRRHADGRWLVLVGFGLGCLIQLHYFTVAVVLVIWCAALYETARAGWRMVPWLLLGAAVFVALLSPLIVHEIRNGFPNVQAAGALAAGGGPAVATDSIPRRLYTILALGLVGGFLTGGIEPLAAFGALVLTGGLVVRPRYPHLLLAALLGATLLLAVAYRGPIFEHYLVPLAPLLYLAVGALAARLSARLVALPAAALLVLNLVQSPLRAEPSYHLARTAAVAAAIVETAQSEPYALWLMSRDDFDAAYRYQLERLDHPPTRPSEPLPRQLFIVCQDPPCDVRVLRATAGVDWADAALTWQADVQGVTVLRLRLPAARQASFSLNQVIMSRQAARAWSRL
jgi:hypothetical protein